MVFPFHFFLFGVSMSLYMYRVSSANSKALDVKTDGILFLGEKWYNAKRTHLGLFSAKVKIPLVR